MGAIPGARQELDRLGRLLREQMTELIDDLTPGGDLRLLFLDEPRVVDWHEPLRHQYASGFDGRRPAGVGAADIAARAAALLGAAGWDVTASREEAGGRARLVVTGRRDGCRIDVRVGDHWPIVWFEGRTPALALYEPQEFEWPEPVCTPENLTPGHVLCYECDGLGWCPACGGRSWVPSKSRGRTRCPECSTYRVCPICRGAGQLAISGLSPYQRGYYREELGERRDG
ncbi:hypothetical protein ACFPM3_29430 [Streptomyces coeruleoprunus]|uniref:Uncharacterized protein n=1 Tax=Streptomyces coeruleoprunus TaxID=285563 RepID=A0ABV9XLM4_9ACTN